MPVFLTIKDGTLVVTSYDKMVRIICDNEPGLSRHILSVLSSIVYVKKNDSDPFYISLVKDQDPELILPNVFSNPLQIGCDTRKSA